MRAGFPPSCHLPLTVRCGAVREACFALISPCMTQEVLDPECYNTRPSGQGGTNPCCSSGKLVTRVTKYFSA